MSEVKDILMDLVISRKAQNITQQELADKLDIGRSTLANIEKGRHSPPLHTLLEICNTLNINIKNLPYCA